LVAGCDSPGRDCASQLARWDLPADLCGRQGQLDTLRLPPAVDSLTWLSAPLKTLIASGTGIRSLAGLPSTLNELDVHYARGVGAMRDLVGLRRLQSLDLRWTALEHFAGLPAGLKTLRIGGSRVKELPPLPESLVELQLDDTDIHELGDLPVALQSLSLSGSSFESISGFPPELRSLTLRGTGLRALPPLPDSLQSLEIIGNSDLTIHTVPRYLSRLVVADEAVPPLEGHHHLRSLYVGTYKGSLPESISVLAIDITASVPPWPPYLRALALTGGATMPKLPPQVHLESLDLLGSGAELAGPLPAGLRSFAASLRDLRDLRPILATIEDLDLTGSPVSSIELLSQAARLKKLVFCDSRLTEIARLPPSLTWLELCGSRSLRRIAALPTGLRVLNVSGTGLRRLPRLPLILRELDISNTDIRTLAGLPPGLETLTLDARQVRTLDGLPPSVKKLLFVERTAVASGEKP
jgi:Leucine-rich repeat (LRR) protein